MRRQINARMLEQGRVYDVEFDEPKPLTTFPMKIAVDGGEPRPLTLFLSEGRPGLPLAYKVSSSTPNPAGVTLSRYVMVSGRMLHDLTVKDVSQMDDIDDVSLVMLAAKPIAANYLSVSDYKGASDTMDALLIPAQKRFAELTGRKEESYSEACWKILSREAPRFPMTENILRLFSAGSAEEAVGISGRLNDGELAIVLLIMNEALKRERQDTDVVRVQSAILRRAGEIMRISHNN